PIHSCPTRRSSDLLRCAQATPSSRGCPRRSRHRKSCNGTDTQGSLGGPPFDGQEKWAEDTSRPGGGGKDTRESHREGAANVRDCEDGFPGHPCRTAPGWFRGRAF